jgi:drug/metabolite transporter (DMT)-like permease
VEYLVQGALVLAIPAVLVAYVGRSTERATGLHWFALAMLVGGAMVAAAQDRATGVEVLPYLEGIVIAGGGVAIGLVSFYWLGKAMRRQPGVILVVATVAVSVPFALLTALALLEVVGLVHCPPDAYECPI